MSKNEAQKTVAAKFEPPKVIPLDEKQRLIIENFALKTELARHRGSMAQRDMFDAGQAQLDATYQVIIAEVPVILDIENPMGLAERYRYSEQAKALILVDQLPQTPR